MAKLKIVRVVTRLNIGGPAQHVTFLTEGLNEGFFETKLVVGRTDDHEGDMSFIAENRGIALIHVETMRNESGLIDDLKSLWQLYRIFKRELPQIVHLHLFKARFIGGVAAKLARVPLIIETFHGNLFSEYYGKLATATIFVAEKFLGHFIMDCIIAVSETQRKELLQYQICPSSKIETISIGLELGRFENCSRLRGELRKELGISGETILVGTIARLVEIKGLSYLLDAISRVARSTEIDFCLLVIGDGVKRGYLESEASALCIEKRVRFLGWRFTQKT